MEFDTLTAQATSLQLINSAKHKAAGKTHRIEVRVHGNRGVKSVRVFYVTTTDPIQKAVNLAVNLKSKVWTDHVITTL